MTSKADRIEAEFPPGTVMPADLRRLCDYLDRTDYPISGSMRLRPEGDSLVSWFGGDTEAAHQFAGFGAGPDGSTLAFWLYRGPDATAAPVVLLDSEGESNFVLASDFRDFLHLFGIGYSELWTSYFSEPPKEPDNAEPLRAWLLAEFGITPPATGAELVQRAQSRHPDVAAWVKDWQKRRYPTA